MGQSDKAWFIVQVNPNCEAKAASEIRRAGFRAYVPKAAKDVRHHRTKQLMLKRRPALVGYIFMRFPSGAPNWYALRKCQGVKGVLYSDGRPYAVRQQEVAALIRAQRAAAFDTPDARSYRLSKRKGEKLSIARAAAREKFRPGMTVRATVGPWEHIIARIDRITRNGTIKAVATLFGRETAVEYTALDEVEAVDRLPDAA